MLNGKRIAVVMPAYNAEKTLHATVQELPDIVDIRILVDDNSADRTVEVARELGLKNVEILICFENPHYNFTIPVS